MFCLFVAQFLAYADLRRSSADKISTLEDQVGDALEKIAGLEARLKENEKLLQEKDDRIDELRVLLDQARAASTGGPPRSIGNLRYLPNAFSTGRRELPYGVRVTVQTDVRIQPIRLRLYFSEEVVECDSFLAGGGVQTDRLSVSRNTCTVTLDMPAFSPSRGLVVTALSKKPINFDRAERLN